MSSSLRFALLWKSCKTIVLFYRTGISNGSRKHATHQSLPIAREAQQMRESSFELAARLRSEAEALEELLIDADEAHTFRSRQEEETKLADLLNLAQDRLASLRLEALQESMEDVEEVLSKLRKDEEERENNGRPVSLIQSFISIAESEKVRLHHIITAAVRAEEESRRLRTRKRGTQQKRRAERTVEGQPAVRKRKKRPEAAPAEVEKE
jgi:hypothetical protein